LDVELDNVKADDVGRIVKTAAATHLTETFGPSVDADVVAVMAAGVKAAETFARFHPEGPGVLRIIGVEGGVAHVSIDTGKGHNNVLATKVEAPVNAEQASAAASGGDVFDAPKIPDPSTYTPAQREAIERQRRALGPGAVVTRPGPAPTKGR
jgi:hypothetical protein